MTSFKQEQKSSKADMNARAIILILFSILASAFLFACGKAPSSKQNLDNGIVEFNGRRYSQAPYEFRIREIYFNKDGLDPEIFTQLAEVNGVGVYSVKGLEPKDWIYFPFGNCDVGLGLCKSEETSLDGSYYDFLDTFQLIKYNYTVKDGLQKTIDAAINNRTMVDYAFKIASSDGSSELHVTSDKLTHYELNLTPRAYPSLQYTVGYFECDEGYFIASNKSKNIMVYTKVDDTIHNMISSLK